MRNRPISTLSLIVVGAVGAFLIAMVGVSAHDGGFLNMVGVHQNGSYDDHASAAREEPKESPEASEKPEATPIAKPRAIPTSDSEPDSDDMPMVSPSPSPMNCSDEECATTSGSGGGD